MYYEMVKPEDCQTLLPNDSFNVYIGLRSLDGQNSCILTYSFFYLLLCMSITKVSNGWIDILSERK